MNTPSHWLMTIVAAKLGPWAGKVPRWSLGLGAIAPDIPLYLLSFGGVFYYSVVMGWGSEKTFPHLYSSEGLYFNDAGWIAFHNLFHSPLSLMLMFAMTFLIQTRLPKAVRWIRFFLTACAFHSVVDILTHHDDGPLLLFPFDWDFRFESSISYWDTKHHGGLFMVFEGLLDLILIGLLAFPRFRNKQVVN